MNGELVRKIALDCSRRCTYSFKGEVDDFGMPTGEVLNRYSDEENEIASSSKHKMALNYAEQVCTSRCTAKWL